MARKKSHDVLPSEKSSRYPFQYLSPESKKMKFDHLRHSMSDIRMKGSKKATLVDRQSMPDVQTNEISEVVRTIHHTEHGQQQLQTWRDFSKTRKTMVRYPLS